MLLSNARKFARKHIVFGKSSPISGRFHEDKYPFIGKPLDSLDKIRVRQTVVYKASSCMGTVFSQIAMVYRLTERPGDMLFVAQSDDDAKDWMITRGKAFIKSIEPLMSTLLVDRNAIQNTLVQWPHQWLIVTGPGANARESKQVRYVHTDEAHLDAFSPGSLAAFNKRMGRRWDRHELHVSTASAEATVDGEGKPVSKEIDVKYHEGQQDEWHQMCPHCNRLFWPLWEQYALDKYGQRVFVWTDSQSENETLDSIHVICPWCNKEIYDSPPTRYEMNLGGDYVMQNPDHQIVNESYRWSALAPDWITWREILMTYLSAMTAARHGDISQMEDFIKKVLCMTWRGHIPDLLDAYISGDYNLGDEWIPTK